MPLATPLSLGIEQYLLASNIANQKKGQTADWQSTPLSVNLFRKKYRENKVRK
jgi:hypothetical protein